MILKTFTEFVSEIQSLFPKFHNEIEDRAINFTTKEHAGHSDVLYQTEFNWFAVEFTTSLNYVIHFNGYKGEGETLELANSKLNEEYYKSH